MADMKFSVRVTGDLAGDLGALFTAQNLPRTHEAVELAAMNVQQMWQGWAMGNSIEGAVDIKKPSANLARSIGVEQTGDFAAEVSTTSAHMQSIQAGRKAQDMKLTYPYGRKSRVFANGNPYLIVPFRWGTPGKGGSARTHFGSQMSGGVYAAAKQMLESARTGGTHYEANARGEAVPRSEYVWGSRLKTANPSAYESGMVRMADATGGSTYFTFRIISARSAPSKWVKKAVPPNDVAAAVARASEADAERIIEAGIKADLGIE